MWRFVCFSILMSGGSFFSPTQASPQGNELPAAAPIKSSPSKSQAEPSASAVTKKQKRKAFARQVCALISGAAGKHNLPAHFLARLIWQESRFDPGAISPKGARGIAQFMPATAARWGLDDPFDPVQAIPKSAQYLDSLHQRLGNLGLAAAGYNAGGGRVSRWMAARSYMPRETRNYVYAITGRKIEEWKKPSARYEIPLVAKGQEFTSACIQLASRQIKLRHGALLRPSGPKKWGVNIAQGNTKAIAMAALRKMQRRFRGLLGQRPTRVVELTLARKRYWSMTIIQVRAKTKREARSLCRKLWKRGGFCLVRAY